MADRPTPATSARTRADEVLDDLRQPARVRLLLRGFGPLLLAAVLFVAMVLLLPSVAPERIVQRPVGASQTTSTGTP
jgi:hypothetical protein